MPTGQDVADFLGKGSDASAVALAEQVVPIVTVMAKAYTRGAGCTDDGQPNDELAAVVVTASARMMANPSQLSHSQIVGPYTQDVRGGFTGWSLAELFVLNRYRKRST